MRIGSHEYVNEADDDGVPKPAQSLGTPVPRQKPIYLACVKCRLPWDTPTNLPLQPRFHQVLKGVERLHSIREASARPRLLITPNILRKMRCAWGAIKQANERMLWVVALTAFFGFCRSGEVTVPREGEYNPAVPLLYWDLACNQMSILLRRTKTDQAC